MGLKIYTLFLDYYLAIILIGPQLWSSSVCELDPGYNIYTSPSVTVQRGLCVHVPCSFTMPSNIQLSISTTGIWYHLYNGDGYPIALKNNSVHQTNGRFFLTGNLYNGDCSYSIEDPLPIDEGRYYFRCEDGPIKFNYLDIQPYVHVIELTDKPIISSTRLVDREEVTWTCTSPSRCRNITPQITWEGPMTGIRQKMYDVTYRDGSRTFHSRVTFTPRKSNSNSPLLCRVTFKSGMTTVEKRALNVEYSPSIKMITKGADTDDITAVNVKDGDSITMKCIVDSNPKASITWYKEDNAGQRTISDRTVTLTLINITPRDAGRYRCFAENEHGATQKMVEIIYSDLRPTKSTFEGTQSQFSPVVAAAVGGGLFLVLVIVIGVFLIKMRKKRQSINKDMKNNVVPPEEAKQENLQSSQGDDLVYMHHGDVQYASIEFSKVKPKEVVPENMETEYAQIRKIPHN